MAYSAIAKVKKNSPYALITSPGISDSATSIPVDHLEYFSDIDGVLIVDGISIWDPTDSDPTHREEITITARSGTSGAGNLTGATRGVKADGTNGAARAFSAGARIAVNFTTGKMEQIADNFAAHESSKAPIASPTFTGMVTTPAIKITGGTPGVGKVLVSDADGDGAWTTVGGGDVVGPASATDGHMAVFDGATGKLLKDGGAPGGGGAASGTDFLVVQIFS
jgi:hypothetical protein